MRRLGIGMAALLLASAGTAQASDETDLHVAKDFMVALAQTMNARATVADIDRVTELLAPDAVYEDAGFGARVSGRDQIRAGLLSHLDDYAGAPEEETLHVDHLQTGPGVVFFDLRLGIKVKGAGGAAIAIERHQITAVEIRSGRVSRIIDYRWPARPRD